MDFSSIPAYLDPSNWQQTPPPHHQHHQQQQLQQNHHGSSSSSINPNINSNPLLPPPPLPPPLQGTAQGVPPHTGQMGGSIRPGSMAERARMANIPIPEPALKCPRCESSNTKFCYYNNYSLSQPRHFCKTCRRYWTRGGALRSVPVGGGCRRNKRSKSSSSGGGGASSSKSAASDRTSSAAATSSANSGGMAGTSSVADILGLTPPPLSAFRFMSPLQHMSDFSGGGGGLGLGSYGGISSAGDLGFQLGSIGGSSVISGSGGGSGMDHQWRFPASSPLQFPFFSGLDPAAAGGSSLYGHPFDGVELSSLAIGHVRSKGLDTAAVKMEGSGGAGGARQDMSANLARQFNLGMLNQHGIVGTGEHYNWGGGGGGIGGGVGGGSSSSGGGGGNAWTDMTSGLNNSSCSTTSAL
ncbi:hypothetical protein V2J09_018912 [Rumex salicifolius]